MKVVQGRKLSVGGNICVNSCMLTHDILRSMDCAVVQSVHHMPVKNGSA